MKSIIVGTAGHVDHGKTALVRALTGINTDRLEEEQRRGITIDLGFAYLHTATPDGKPFTLAFIDVPGHERFVRNMLAGMGGIDMVLLVIAADEGIKPQTREHFDICRLLGIQRGITVLTKADTVDAETLEVVRMEVQEFLRGTFLDTDRSPLMAVSAHTGQGIPELKHELVRMALEASQRSSEGMARLPIDRVFTIKGFGTVVTGTLVSGTLHKDQEIELQPFGRTTRIRGLQVHDRPTDTAYAGQRTAVNLAGVTVEELQRGMTLATPHATRALRHAEVSLTLLPTAPPLRERTSVHLHAYSSEQVAQVILLGRTSLAPGETGFARIHFSEPTTVVPGDRFILRQFSPVITIAGGTVLDTTPLRKLPTAARLEQLRTLQEGNDSEKLLLRVRRRGALGLAIEEAIIETGWTAARVLQISAPLVSQKLLERFGNLLIDRQVIQSSSTKLVSIVTAHHAANPLTPGISREELRERLSLKPMLYEGVVRELVTARKIEVEGDIVRLTGRGVTLQDEESRSRKRIEEAFEQGGLKPPSLKDVLSQLKLDEVRARKIVTLMLREAVLVKIAEDMMFHRSALESLKARVRSMKAKSPEIDVTRFKDTFDLSRKHAIPLLEWLDRNGVTRRSGNARVIL